MVFGGFMVLFTFNRHFPVICHHQGFIMPDADRPVIVDPLILAVQHNDLHIFLCVQVNFFLVRGVLKPQLVKPASFIGLRPYRHLRLRPRRTVVLMVRPAHDYRLVRVPVQEVHYHFLTHTRYRQVTEPRPRPRL
ncbi:hypothetical protein HmCmsJML105_00744 [Escherichia coli]|nr:hypothetical protein HmCmsJML105_00744 [Escherichia coli]